MILCGWITTVGGAIVVLTGAWKKFKKPERDLEKRMQTMEEDIKDIKSKLEKDYTSIRTQRDDMNLIMRSMFNLIENKNYREQHQGLKKTGRNCKCDDRQEKLRGLILKVYEFTVPELEYFRAIVILRGTNVHFLIIGVGIFRSKMCGN